MMDLLIDFIFDNIWLVIAAIVFLAGFRKSKKKKDRPTKPSPPPVAEVPGDPEFEDADLPPKNPWGPVDDLPIPDVLKKVMKEQLEPKESRRKDAPWSKPEAEKKMSQPKDGHYDAPWSGEGKVFPHREVTSTVKTGREYHYDAPWSGEGKALPHHEVAATVYPSNVPAAIISSQKESSNITSALTPKKMAEAVVLSEILGKPKALRGRNQR